MSSTVTVRHNFETGHRLPFLEGKCENLHGHSWWAEITVTSPTETAVVVEFGLFKAAIRKWIDDHLDHGLMLGKDDPLATLLPAYGKVYTFGASEETADLDWPTVENVARMLGRVGEWALKDLNRVGGAYVSRVSVTETHVNRAEWIAPEPEVNREWAEDFPMPKTLSAEASDA